MRNVEISNPILNQLFGNESAVDSNKLRKSIEQAHPSAGYADETMLSPEGMESASAQTGTSSASAQASDAMNRQWQDMMETMNRTMKRMVEVLSQQRNQQSSRLSNMPEAST